MSDDTGPGAAGGMTAGRAGPLLLASGGLAAGFGAASCCVLPMLFSSVGLGTAWLLTVAQAAAPYRTALAAVAIASAAAGGPLLWRRRRQTACSPAVGCGRPAIIALTAGALSLSGVLAVLGLIYG